MKKFSAVIEGIDNGFLFSAGIVNEPTLVRAYFRNELDLMDLFANAWHEAEGVPDAETKAIEEATKKSLEILFGSPTVTESAT